MDKAVKDFAQKILSELNKILHRLDQLVKTHEHNKSSAGDECRYSPPARWKRWLEAGALGAAILYSIVTAIQWSDFRHNFKIDERAWIGIKTIDLSEPSAGEALRCEIKMVNSGKTFALDITGPGFLQTSRIGLQDAIASAHVSNRIPYTHVLFPSIDENMPFKTDSPLTAEQASSVSLGTLQVYVFGDIYYRDIFGDRHVTHYCGHYVTTTKRFEDCGTSAN
jgi:hypothetical protein